MPFLDFSTQSTWNHLEHLSQAIHIWDPEFDRSWQRWQYSFRSMMSAQVYKMSKTAKIGFFGGCQQPPLTASGALLVARAGRILAYKAIKWVFGQSQGIEFVKTDFETYIAKG